MAARLAMAESSSVMGCRRMALDKQVVGVNFTQGLDTQTDKRLVLPGKMVALQNATMSEADTYKRRNGNTTMVSGTTPSGVPWSPLQWRNCR